MRRLLALGIVLAAAWASPASAGVGYDVVVESPLTDPSGRYVLRDLVSVQARADGGVGDVEQAAYHLRQAGRPWSGGEATAMPRVEERRFRAASPLDTGGLPNGAYELEIRMWGGVPAYDPADPNTFARRVVPVRIDNFPPAPEGLGATASVGGVRLTWSAVATADRADFAGYRIWVAEGACPAQASGFEAAGRTRETTFALLFEDPGDRCFLVTAARTSELTGLIESPSRPVLLPVASADEVLSKAAAPSRKERRGSAGRISARPAEDVHVEEGTFEPDLPYGPAVPQVEIVQVPAVAAEAAEPVTVAAVSDETARGGPIRAIAGGLILVVSALQIRRFLSGGRA